MRIVGVCLLLLATSLLAFCDIRIPNNESFTQDKSIMVNVRYRGEDTVITGKILTKELAVKTAFGTLQVPMNELVVTTTGIRLTEAEDTALRMSIKKLHSTAYKERDAAMKELTKLGRKAVVAIDKTLANDPPKDLEAAQRLLVLYAQLRKISQVMSDQDTIETTKFNISGEIMTTKLLIQHDKLGLLEVGVTDIEYLAALITRTHRLVMVPSADVNTWRDTTVFVPAGSTLSISATGEMDYDPTVEGSPYKAVGPNGSLNNANANAPFPLGSIRIGTLIGKVGYRGEPFIVGSDHESIITRSNSEDNRLYLSIVAPAHWNYNTTQGDFKVTISTGFRN